jgi:hypothetical protein
VATAVVVTGIAYVLEDRGTPPVPTLIETTTYQLLDAGGNVVQDRPVGQASPAAPGPPLARIAARQAELARDEVI